MAMRCFLAAAQLEALLANWRIVPFIKLGDKFMGVGGFGGLFYLC